MAKIVKIPESESTFQLQFMCPACKMRHSFNSTWEFNGDYDLPSVSPSILTYGHRFDENHNSVPFRCHSWITKGKIKFFSDCSHEIEREKWIDLLDIE